MIYIDSPTFQKVGGRESYAHMAADSYKELHAFANQIGVGPHFFHKKARYHHYDVSTKHYKKAVDAGAMVVSSKELIFRSRVMMLTEQLKGNK